MSDNYDKESSGMVCAVSRQAGAVAGASVSISKKIVGCGVKTVAAAKDCLKQPLKHLVPARDKKSGAASQVQASAVKSGDVQETGRKKAARALIATLESDLVTAQHDLKKAQNNAEKTHSKLTSQLVELKEEKEMLVSDLEQAKGKADEAAAQEDEAKTLVQTLESDLSVAQSVEQLNAKTEDLLSQKAVKAVKAEKTVKAVKAKKPSSGAVTDEEVQAAVFANQTDKIIFMRAFTDIASGDATVRVDAAKTMAGVHHELSVKVLAAQMTCESSVQVRQECIKALVTMEMTEALSAVERALTDEAGSVRLAAVWGLYHLTGAESSSSLIRMFTDDDEEVRRRAATCIGWLGKEELAVKLLPLLDDNSISVRQAAVEAMNNLRSREVVSSLIERLNDPVESIRKVILRTIETITGKKMSKSFPKDQKEFERLVVRWQQWRKEQLSG